MDSNQREREPQRLPLTVRPALAVRPLTLARPTRFEPQPLTDSRGASDAHTRQMIERARTEGLKQAQAEVDAAIAEHTAAAQRLSRAADVLFAAAAQLQARDQDDLGDIEEHAIRFGVDLAEQLVGRELRSCDAALEAAISRALSLAPDRGPVVLRVNPGDLAATRSGVDDRAELPDRVELVADPSVEIGGCIAVVGPLRIDAQIGSALARVRGVVDGG